MMEKVTWFPVHLMKFDENLNPTLKNYHLQIISLNWKSKFLKNLCLCKFLSYGQSNAESSP